MRRSALDEQTLQVAENLSSAQPITLVLGAGVSCSRGAPLWGSLAETVWMEAFGTPYPYASRAAGHRHVHPFGHQFALELVERQLHEQSNSANRDEFVAALSRVIYKNIGRARRGKSSDTLGVLAQLLRRESEKGQGRRVERVITLNVDSLLEDEVHRGRRVGFQRTRDGLKACPPMVWPVSRASDDHTRAPHAIPIYHLHGYLPNPGVPRPKRKTTYHQLRDATQDTLVFTDWQYWKLSTTPAGFANRVFSTALHDSHCIFIGVSFTDVNLLRWLGMRSVELALDLQSEFSLGPRDLFSSQRRYREPHAWIRPVSADPGGVISEVLKLRGIKPITIDSWDSAQFALVMKRIFSGSSLHS
jgi:SIR2-like domain